MKVWLGVVLGVLFWLGYFTVQRLPVRPVTTLDPTWFDDAVGFSPTWVWPYLSIYLLFPTAWLALTRDDLRRYAAGFVAVSLVSFAFFLAWPVHGPRPDDAPLVGIYGLLITLDSPLNSFPSLHMSLATYAACFAVSVLHGRAGRIAAALLGAAWVLLIGYATVATKQHYAVDAAAGVALGLLAHVVVAAAWRRSDVPVLATAEGGTA